MNHQKGWSELQKHNIAQSVRGYKVKPNYYLVAIIIGLFIALIWITYGNAKKTDQQAKIYFSHIQVEQPIKTSAQRIILQGE